jgi:hypothetical protein
MPQARFEGKGVRRPIWGVAQTGVSPLVSLVSGIGWGWDSPDAIASVWPSFAVAR